jgi:DNA-binding NarL/FixJ family response regulator
MRPRVLLADDHTLVAEGIARLLERDFDLVARAENGRDMIDQAQAAKPDLILADISMPVLNGIEATRQLKKIMPEVRVIFLSMHSDVHYVSDAIRAGASGYVLKRSAPTELPEAINEVLAGRTYITPLISTHVVESAEKQKDVLTTRQREVLQLVAEGYSAKDIANTLQISVKTAEFHKAGIMQKLGLHSTADLTKFALEHGITSKSVS